MFASTFLLLVVGVICASASTNRTMTSPLGLTCTYYGNNEKVCKESADYKANLRKLFMTVGEGMRKKSSGKKALVVGSGDVCSSVAPYMPSFCTCADNSGGAVATCPYAIPSISDTITFVIDMEVCANPATVGVTLTDALSGITFTESITSGETGSVPTGIELSLAVASVGLNLVYTMTGNIDSLYVQLGIDLVVTVLYETVSCASYFPADCPYIFFDETIDFGNYC